MSTLVLKPGREASLKRRHPWIFSGAIQGVEGETEAGEVVEVRSASGEFLARAAYSPASQIRARVWTFDPDEAVDEAFFRQRLQAALSRRRALLGPLSLSPGLRLVHAESDGLPGLIVDRYADALVVQCLTIGVEVWRRTIFDLLVELTGLSRLYERSDAEVRALEGLSPRAGAISREWTSPLVVIEENGLRFQVDVAQGHKTGFYLDQRENRAFVRRLAEGREVLDCFCYTGGFTVNALAGGARSVLSIESSSAALNLCRENVSLNSLPFERLSWMEGDAFRLLRRLRDENRSFDLIILDPPRFAPTAAQVSKAARAYKDINLLAFKLLRPGGILVTFSCSGGVDAILFQKIVAAAALDSGVEAQIMGYLFQAADHPVALHFPEGAYLKGLVCLKS